MVNVKEIEARVPRNPEEFCIKPYDVISDAELKELRNIEKSAIHVVLPNGDDVYATAKDAIKKCYDEQTLIDGKNIYLYEESSPEFTQRGFIIGVSLEDYGMGKVKIHEKTREKPLKDRIQHIESTNSHTGLVWLVYKKNEQVKSLMNEIQKSKTMFNFDKYGYKHKVWKLTINEQDQVKRLFTEFDLYVADGHHRVASAYEYYKNHPNNTEAKYVMTYCASNDEIRILPYNRIIRKLNVPEPEFIDKLSHNFEVTKTDQKSPGKGEIMMRLTNDWYILKPKNVPQDVVGKLDVSILQNQILSPVLGIEDPRVDPNIFFEGGILSNVDLEKYVTEKGNAIVFFMHPTAMTEIEEVADAKLDMPPKSTWFDPKVLTGLVFHKLD